MARDKDAVANFNGAIRVARRFYGYLTLSRRSDVVSIRDSGGKELCSRKLNEFVIVDGGEARNGACSMNLLADTRLSLTRAIEQLAAINAGALIASPLTRKQAINIVTEQIGLFESVLRQYDDEASGRRRH